MKRAVSVARDQLVSLGVCVGKFTHSDKFRLTIGALDLLAAHAKHKARPGPGPVSSRPARTNERRRPRTTLSTAVQRAPSSSFSLPVGWILDPSPRPPSDWKRKTFSRRDAR
eukprot:29123-Pelagococcus_subviridis.AAC.5